MGGTIPLSLPQAAPLPILSNMASSLVLPAAVTQTSGTLSILDKPLSINGTLIGLLENGGLNVQTGSGLIQLALLKVDKDTQKILNSLLKTRTDAEVSFEIVLKAGSPPKQALLIIPQNEVQKLDNRSSPVTTQTQAETPSSDRLFQKGQTLTITVLPEDIDRAAITAKNAEQHTPTSHAQREAHVPKFIERVLGSLNDKVATAATKTAQILIGTHNDPINPQPIDSSQKLVSDSRLFSAQNLRLKIDHVFTPDMPWPEMMKPEQIKATVINRSLSGHLLLESEGQTIFVHQTGGMKDGSKIIATPLPLTDYPTSAIPRRDQRDFPPLRDMIAALTQADPQTSGNFLNAKLPTPMHNLAGTVLFLLNALQNGKIDEWLGQPVLAQLERVGKKKQAMDFVSTLESSMTQTVRDPSVGEWRAYPLPLHYSGSYDMLRLYVHHDQKRDAATDFSNKPDKTRFVITMNMSRLGSLQLDGLSQPRKLDLIIRSEASLPENLIHELRETTVKTLEATGLIGSLTFQTGRKNWMVFQKTENKEWVT